MDEKDESEIENYFGCSSLAEPIPADENEPSASSQSQLQSNNDVFSRNKRKLENGNSNNNTRRSIVKKKRRYRPGERALAEIRKFQKTTRPVIARAPFSRLCREIIQEIAPNRDTRIQSEGISALQEASEAFLVTFFEAANRCAIHARRVTVTPADFSLLRWILNAFGINWL